MINTHASLFANSYRKPNRWLEDLTRELSRQDRRKAYRALRIKRQAFRERTPWAEPVSRSKS